MHAESGADLSVQTANSIIALYLVGWCITRGANMQKYYYRTQPEEEYFLVVVPQVSVPGTRILCSGWWGVARHFNYFGEILQAIAVALPGSLMCLYSSQQQQLGSSENSCVCWTYALLPWLYPLYYVALFVPRQLDDDEVCKQKYGEAWDRYVEKVPYRIVPGVW